MVIVSKSLFKFILVNVRLVTADRQYFASPFGDSLYTIP